MNKPTPWPRDMGTRRGTGLETTLADTERWADNQHVYRGTHRVTMAEPRLTEADIDNANISRALDPMTEPYVLNAMQSQAADKQATSREFAARQAEQAARLLGTGEVSDYETPQPGMPGESKMLGWLLLLSAVSVALGAVAVRWWFS